MQLFFYYLEISLNYLHQTHTYDRFVLSIMLNAAWYGSTYCCRSIFTPFHHSKPRQGLATRHKKVALLQKFITSS